MKDETLRKVLVLVKEADDREAALILNALNMGAQRRHSLRQQEAMLTIKLGDEVRIRNAKPKYLIGTRATVINVLPSEGKFKIEFGLNVDPRAIRRWGRQVTCPASMLEKV